MVKVVSSAVDHLLRDGLTYTIDCCLDWVFPYVEDMVFFTITVPLTRFQPRQDSNLLVNEITGRAS